ncbi:pyridoxamine 5'-phosphate oxidase [Natronococcus pandeyae]|uniref:Pyridoxamine 5'-phosphate oxidase n=1 Tax=Natronococcus pandeyae TaxID=2055836 RepID=A0A8J8PZS4_9EURY|nr:pyridoxamine 5'-phosphate oxidase family protein [Natronococcus pandeyae]TYL37475.1 pyridoxamine 5'-phosphate oxidase [Natronococcus pandeyae]
MTQNHSGSANEARRSRPSTEASYGIPEREEGMLPWTFVEEKMGSDRSYWVTTIRPDGRPHVRPTWGVWVDGTFYCGGGERTRWVRNLSQNSEVVVHRESATAVVIIEGTAVRLDDETGDSALVERIDAAYEEKYDIRHGTPFFGVRPDVVFAWSDYPTDATRWTFSE